MKHLFKKILDIIYWLLQEVGFWDTVIFMLIIFILLFGVKIYLHIRSDKKEKAVIDAKEQQIILMAEEVRYNKKLLLIERGHTIEEADKIINGNV